MRVIGGTWGGRVLKAPRGTGTRPTADRVREALFNVLGPPPEGTRVLDLFAGAGGLGLEALSRGAEHAVFIDSSRRAIDCLQENIGSLGAQNRSDVHLMDAWRGLNELARQGQTFTWIFVDPPYQSDLGSLALSRLAEGPLMNQQTSVICEHDKWHVPEARVGRLERFFHRQYGDTCLSLYRRGDSAYDGEIESA